MSKQLEFDWGPVKVISNPNVHTGYSHGPGVVSSSSFTDYFKKAPACEEPRRVTGEPAPKSEPILSTDSEERKNTPIFSGVLAYFPLAIAAVARHSKRGNDKHNPGEPLHWAREKSTDHADCIARHLIDVGHFNTATGEYDEACALAWRALAKLQLLEEKRLGRSK